VTAVAPTGRLQRWKLPTSRRWGHWTLRSRLVVVVAVLTALALLAANVAGLVLLRSYLTERVDEQLRRMIVPYTVGPFRPDPRPPAELAQRLPPGGGAAQALLLFQPDGTALPGLLSTEDVAPPRLGDYPDLRGRAGSAPFTVPATAGDDRWRVLVATTDGGGLVVLATSLREVDATAERLLLIDAAVLLLVVAVLGLIAAAVVRIGLRPLTRMERISAEIAAGDFSRRVEGTDPHTEPGRLGIALNIMLDRIGSEIEARAASERRLRQFVADASHELRTPLTSIRGFAELYRRGGAPPGPILDETMSRIESEAARMTVLVEDLLLLARLDQQRPLRRDQVDLLAIAADTIRDARARAPERTIRLAPVGADDGPLEPVTVPGDEYRLRQVATNLVANAVQHTPPEAEITVRVGRVPGADEAVLEVADTGQGIPDEHATRIFERLYRVDSSRTRAPGVGSGLGLSIVAAIVRHHGGRVELETAVGRGSRFRVLLPTRPDLPPGSPVTR
jgi:two-component system OmpR family sensor kinase